MWTFCARDRLLHWPERDRAFDADPFARDLEIGLVIIVDIICRSIISGVLGSTTVGGVPRVRGEPCGCVRQWRRVFTGMRGIVKELLEVDVGVVVCVSTFHTKGQLADEPLDTHNSNALHPPPSGDGSQPRHIPSP